MLPLSKIHIKGFKSLRDVDIDLGQVNVFIGENGAGKSNILEAIGFLSTALSGTMDYNKLEDRGVRLSTPEVFKCSFRNADRPKEIRIESMVGGNMSYAVTILPAHTDDSYLFSYKNEALHVRGQHVAGRSHSGAKVSGRPIPNKPSPKSSILITADALGAISANVAKRLDSVGRFGIYAPSTPILRGIATDRSRQDHLGLYGGNLATALGSLGKQESVALVRSLKAMFKWIRSVEMRSPDTLLQSKDVKGNWVVAFTDRFMKSNFNVLYAYDVSEGALYVLFVLCLLLHNSSPKLFALDNIDSTLNPGLVTSLVREIVLHTSADSSKQVLLTSHNPTTLDALDLFDDAQRLFVVERGENGGTSIKRIKPPEGMTREGWGELLNQVKLSELWLSGSIGALHQE